MIDYQYQHAAHIVDWRMHLEKRANPRQQPMPLSQEQIENERAWLNFETQLNFGWIKR